MILVDESERFEFKPMLYQLLTGEVESWEVAPRYRDLLEGSDVEFLRGRVSGVSLPGSQTSTSSGADETSRGSSALGPAGGSLSLEDGTQVDWDWLVLALGAETRLSGVPGAVEHAMPFTSVRDAEHLEERLALLEQNEQRKGPIQVAVVGGGFSGVELAMCVKARLGAKGSVVLLERGMDLLKSGTPHSREQAWSALKSAGVRVQTGTGVKQVTDGALVTTLEQADGSGPVEETLESDVTLWTVGVQPAGGPAVLGELPSSDNGFLQTDATLQVHGHPRVFAVGDIASVPDVRAADLPGRQRGDEPLPRLPATAQVAMQQAEYVCWNVWFASRGRPLLNFRYQHLGEMMSLGPGRGSIAASPLFGGVGLDGPLAELARKAVYALRMPTNEHRAAVGLSWLARGLSDLSGLRNEAPPPPSAKR